jgi:integrase
MPEPTKKLTQLWIDKGKVAEGREIRSDTIVRALAMRMSHTGRKVWQITYRMPGERRKQVFDLGHYSKAHLGFAEARKRAQEILEGVRAGIDPKKKPEEPDVLTLKKLAAQYIERYAKAKGKKTWDRDQELLDRNVLGDLGDRPAHEIRKREFIELLEAVARTGKKGNGAPIAANRTLAVLKTMYKWANQVDVLESYDPVRDIPKIAPENRRDRVLSVEEICKVWAVFGDSKKLRGCNGPMFKMRLITAQRGGEIEHMRWQDLDLEGGWWNIPKEFTKPNRAHRVPLSPMALAIIQAQPRTWAKKGEEPSPCEWVFPNPKTGKPIMNPQKAADQVVTESGVSFVLHDLRRTASTYMVELGIPELHVERVLNHAEKGVTNQVYNRHKYDKEKRQALERWAARLGEIVGA